MGMDRARQGFTLVELSIVLIVIALVAGMGISAGLDSLESTKRVATEKKLDAIETALTIYREKYGRLPCPGSSTLATTNANYGVAATNLGNCYGGTPSADTKTGTAFESEAPQGAVPVRTLELPDEFMYDAWGRKFRYMVTPEMTNYFAFLNSSPYDSCTTTVVDHSGADLPLKAMYSLISYGKNGSGGYLATGSAHAFTGTPSTYESPNIRAYNTANSIRIRNGLSGTGNSYYDDIVRFKMRYQMMDEVDRTTAVYRGPDAVLMYNTNTSGAGNPQAVFIKRICGKYEQVTLHPDSTFVTENAIPRFAAFTANNTNLFVYYTGLCRLYSIKGHNEDGYRIDKVSSGTPVPNCPGAATVGAMAKSNSILALNHTSSPYVKIYEMAGTGDSAVYSELTINSPPSSIPNNITLSENGDYLTLSSNQSGSEYARLYVKSGSAYDLVSGITGGPGSPLMNAISPNGRYYVEAGLSSAIDLYVWRRIGADYTLLSGGGASYTYATRTGINKLMFSDNSDTVGALLSPNNAYGNVYINPATEAVSAPGISSSANSLSTFALTKDGKQFLLGYGTTGAAYDIDVFSTVDYSVGLSTSFPVSYYIQSANSSNYVNAIATAH